MLFPTRLLQMIFTGLVLVLSVACSSNNSNSGAIEQRIDQAKCSRGFIRPPGIVKCINLSDAVAGKVKDASRKRSCAKNWQRQTSRGYCLPTFSIVGCGSDSFKCNSQGYEQFQINLGPPKCPEGTIVVSTDAPLFGENGALFLGTRQVLACGPPSKVDPV